MKKVKIYFTVSYLLFVLALYNLGYAQWPKRDFYIHFKYDKETKIERIKCSPNEIIREKNMNEICISREEYKKKKYSGNSKFAIRIITVKKCECKDFIDSLSKDSILNSEEISDTIRVRFPEREIKINNIKPKPDTIFNNKKKIYFGWKCNLKSVNFLNISNEKAKKYII